MTKRMSAREARENFSDVLGQVYYGKEQIIVERKGKPMAVIISPEQFERYEGQVTERFRRVVEELQQLNADKDPDEIEGDIAEAVEEVRREQFERECPAR
ncbi:MAG TPA: type II toxin-antitoxin system Phd/YefM family antitoxin [Dehalococcoidia bacterium]|nr:type II toxin-antitoxin system Phd/YefM family antitoxin [Dehalococcoidia bacterium]